MRPQGSQPLPSQSRRPQHPTNRNTRRYCHARAAHGDACAAYGYASSANSYAHPTNRHTGAAHGDARATYGYASSANSHAPATHGYTRPANAHTATDTHPSTSPQRQRRRGDCLRLWRHRPQGNLCDERRRHWPAPANGRIRLGA